MAKRLLTNFQLSNMGKKSDYCDNQNSYIVIIIILTGILSVYLLFIILNLMLFCFHLKGKTTAVFVSWNIM